MKEHLIREIMVSPVITVNENDNFSVVEEKFRLHKIRHLPVINKENQLVGIITQRDLFHTVSPRKTEDGDYYEKTTLDSYLLKHAMTPNPLALQPDNTVTQAIDVFATLKYGCIPIINQSKKLVGIITQIDALKFVSKWLRNKDQNVNQ